MPDIDLDGFDRRRHRRSSRTVTTERASAG